LQVAGFLRTSRALVAIEPQFIAQPLPETGRCLRCELADGVVSLGLKGAALHRGEPIARVKANAEPARLRLRMVA
jgi:hypothetical protein